MTDKERLEEIKEKYSEVTVLEYINDIEIVGVDMKDLVWLINRVEKVEHLQELKKLYEEILEWYAHPETYKRAGNGEYVIMTDKGWNAKWALNKRLKGYSD